MSNDYNIKPYARLLTMLGDQLIKNEKVALIELVKNAYDADATWVRIEFNGFGPNYEATDASEIVIEDNGLGMTKGTITKHWLNPATPKKRLSKKIQPRTKLGRFVQGEKGIGRFALLKLGKTVEMITKAQGKKQEHDVTLDVSSYSEDFLTEPQNDDEEPRALFLDELQVQIETHDKPRHFIKGRQVPLGTRFVIAQPYGTRIVISNLRGGWSSNKVEEAYRALTKLQGLNFLDVDNTDVEDESVAIDPSDFNIYFYKDNTALPFVEAYTDDLTTLMRERSVLKITGGHFDQDNKTLSYKVNGRAKSLDLGSSIAKGYRVFKDYFNGPTSLVNRKTECGDFDFTFFIFDFSKDAPPRYAVSSTDRALIRPHRIYLFRDGLRVFPYGDANDDWLSVDQMRGKIAAGDFLSNDQVIGQIDISHFSNPKLRDKTNREGLIEDGNAFGDFVAILQTLLMHIKSREYDLYKSDQKNRELGKQQAVLDLDNEFSNLINLVKTEKKGVAIKAVQKLETSYKFERKRLTERAEVTEDLAGIGLSVEAASHDIHTFLRVALANLDGLIRDASLGNVDPKSLQKDLQALRGSLSFIETQLKDVQLLFRSSRQRRKTIRVQSLLSKVLNIYKRTMARAGITVDVEEVSSPLFALTTDAVILQILINLIDNSVYWLKQSEIKDPQIKIILNGSDCTLKFSDNGPGIEPDFQDYIFEPFISGKGNGRGLGLYIARQLLERQGYSIQYISADRLKSLPGANFLITFIED